MSETVSAAVSSAVSKALHIIAEGRFLGRNDAEAAFAELMRGEVSAARTAALLMGLRARGETPEELAGAILALRGAMRPVASSRPGELVDTCGTGGGTVGTLNISTAAAFVAAGVGVPVAKHGNRSFTSRSGSADVIEALGVDIGLEPEQAARVLEQAGIVFLFAPTFHPAMRHVSPVRKELGIHTLMNLVGPLANPAGARRQVAGAADASRAALMARALAEVGVIHALVVHGEVGMDEISPAGATLVWEIRGAEVSTWRIDPAEFGLAHDDLAALAGGEPQDNATRIERILEGRAHGALRCAVALNAGAAIYVAGRAGSIREAMEMAVDALDSGKGAEALGRLRQAAPTG